MQKRGCFDRNTFKQNCIDLVFLWQGILGNGVERKIFDFLLEEQNGMFSKEDLAAHLEYSNTSGHFSNVIGKLKKLGLIEKTANSYHISKDYLFAAQ